ncbi:MAG: hypothetical protein GEV12_07390 [Micromonosporaceae bacterium]|nr:hypothetical protein [Micromonosporaceae bacterium]
MGAMLWVHALAYTDGSPLLSHVPYLGLDVLFALPVAGVAVAAAGWLRHRLGLEGGMLVRAASVAAVFTVLLVPLATLQGYGHAVLGTGAGHQHAANDLAGLAGYGATTALQAWPAVLAAALLGVLGQRLLAEPAFRRRAWRRVVGSRRPLTVVSAAGALLAGIAVVAVLPASPAVAQAGGCNSGATTRTFNVSAIDVTITVNRHGDNDPYGYMYALDQDITEIREFEQKLENASRAGSEFDDDGVQLPPRPDWPELIVDDPEDDLPDATFVSNGLDQDPIQPLVLRARLGECVVINFTNRLTPELAERDALAPVSGGTNRMFQFPGGVPSVSLDMQGVSYDAAGGDGGQDVGNNPSGNAPTMVGPGDQTQYRFFIDPLMGEGTRTFRSGGESTQLTAHGLFGALIAEPADAEWFDPDTGENVTGDGTAATAWSNWEAMIQADSEEVSTFREFAILYHEVGDETYTLRRPLREALGGATNPVDDPFATEEPRQIGGALPMIDRRAPDANPFQRGGGSTSYRPGGKAINYRAESFFRRLQHETLIALLNGGSTTDAARAQLDNKSLGYSSYTYGDPATPIAESYLGEPTKTRLAHVGFEQLHVHHLHGGADRWRQNPNADDTAMDSGLDKEPIQDATSIRLDSQTISPQESFNLEHECGAGGCQQAPGDYLYHCHIAHHYISGMWGIWRVFDAEQDAERNDPLVAPQDDLAPLPDETPPPAGVNSAGLIGTELPDGRTIVAGDADTTDTIGIDSWVPDQLPPGAEDIDRQDAMVWDWLRSGPEDAPVYVGEPDYGNTALPAPETEPRSWENFRSDTPGQRPQILFNPTNGRPAYPMLRPHLGERPPFAPDEHSGAPYLGETGNAGRPDGLCPAAEDVRTYNITAVTTPIQMTAREQDPAGMLFMLNDEFTLNADDVAEPVSGKVKEPLTIRSNVGDCVAITLGNQINTSVATGAGFKELAKTNMHSHFIQFDPQASDGVIVGFNYEQSVFPTQRDGRVLTSPVGPGTETISVNQTDRLHANADPEIMPDVAIAVGVGTPEIEIRTIESVVNNTITFTEALDNSHPADVAVSVEFVQYRWFSDVDSGTVFWHDHVDGIISWAHGLFGAHIIEPEGSTYHDPVTGAPVDSGTIVDIHNDTSGASVGVGQSGDFREYMMFLHNGRPASATTGDNARGNKFGQECEEATINLRAAPLGDRTPPGTVTIDPLGDPLNVVPTSTQQRFEYNGDFECRNSYDRTGPSGTPLAPAVEDSVAATVTSVDPYAFSSVKYGEPETPLLRAYVGDDVVIRTIGVNERAEGLRIQGHRFRMERFNEDGRLMDTAVTGISERFDYVLDGGAGGTGGVAGDFLYYSSRTFALESGAWGIFRVHDTLQPDSNELQPLSDNTPPTGQGFPILEPNEADNPQANPGDDPPPAGPETVSDPSESCPRGQIPKIYSITAFDHPLPSAPFSDTEGVVYALTSDVAAIQNGEQEVEPLVLRINQGDCVNIRLRNRIESDSVGDPAPGTGSLYGGTRAGVDLSMLARNQQLNGGAAVGLNPDNTAAAGQDTTYRFFADQEVGTTIFQNLGSPASLRHGAYGMLIVEPAGSQWFDSTTGAELGSTDTSTEAVIDPPNGPAFREFALTVHSTDQQYSRSVIPYLDVVAGTGINSLRAIDGGPNDGNQPEVRPAPVAGAPPGTENTNGSFNKAFNHVNYRTEPLTERIGLTAAPGHLVNLGDPGWFVCSDETGAAACDPNFAVASPYGTSFNSGVHQDPATPVLEAHSGDPVVVRVGIPTSDQLHSFVVSGHMFPLEPNMWNGTTDRRSQLMSARTLTGGMTLDAELVGGAGGPSGNVGDYAYRDARQPFTQAGMWGILRVLPSGGGIIPLP